MLKTAELDLERKGPRNLANSVDTGTPGRTTRVEAEGQHAGTHHTLPPPQPGEPPEVATARVMLDQTESDPGRQLGIVRRVLDAATYAPPETAQQLLGLLAPFTRDYPALASAISTRLATLAPRGHLDPQQQLAATAFNAAHADNVRKFLAASHLSSGDANAIAGWQQAHGIAIDGKVGPATLAKVASATTASLATPVTTASTGGGGGGSGSSGGGATVTSPTSGKHPPPPEFLSSNPALAQQQRDLRLRQYDEDPAIRGYIPPHDVNVSMLQRYSEISAQCSYSRELRVLMVGSSRAEQGDSTLNYNFAGVEGYWLTPPSNGTPWTRGYRSATITEKQYRDNPEVFLNYPAAGKGSVEDQLKVLPPGGKLAVAFYGPRPAYATLTAAVTSFVHEIKRRIEAFRAAGDPAVAIAESGGAGAVDAYIKMIHTTTPNGIPPYNAEGPYPGQVRTGIAIARADPSIAKEP